jgi:hypothetical protein
MLLGILLGMIAIPLLIVTEDKTGSWLLWGLPLIVVPGGFIGFAVGAAIDEFRD